MHPSREDLERLEDIYLHAQEICNPIEFQNRQQLLLEALAYTVLAPLRAAKQQERIEEYKKSQEQT